MDDLVFGYGSLARADGRPATLRGARRTWGVAMDNRVDLPGYKFYVDREAGTRPEVYVAFLDLRPADDSTNGVLLEALDVQALDDRERNYARTDVTDRVAGAPDGARVWAYVGRDEARERFRRGLAAGRAVVSREYRDGVLAGFRALGDGALEAFEASTDPLPCPLRDLERIDLP